ncbi:MAG TPA: adenosylcobinamide-phosphate synthase CbiB [Novimethylophilus sp.]|jgi:adenosylcobinamide-phosphate synthase|uniref:adenosylcobinamide-phosphate synthase CbiB n=1 Tax=Novimethylophilus sp. TaxID=2137426 RepID=UPI002F428D72
MSLSNYPTAPLVLFAAVMLDFWLGEPRRFHPLVGFGNIVNRMEVGLNPPSRQAHRLQRITGLLAVAMLLLPAVLFAAWLGKQPLLGPVTDMLLLYFAIGHKSLHDHANAVAKALAAGDEAGARHRASMMVSRDSAAIDPVPAATESVLENGNDGVFGAIFWFLVAGGAGALMFRLANTLDAMWGYRTPRLLYFGWAAARFDDALNYVPARLTALTYALLGETRLALTCWRRQAPAWDSPNAGPVMAAGAGALGVRLGGAARYQGEWHERPVLGAGPAPIADDIGRALRLVRHGVWLWLALALLAGGLLYA